MLKKTLEYDDFYKNNLEDIKKIFIWRTGKNNPEVLEEFISKFMLYIVKNEVLSKYNQDYGSFKTYITTCTLNFLKKERNKEKTLKTGNSIEKVSFDMLLPSDLTLETSCFSEELDIQTDWIAFCTIFLKNPSISKIRKSILKLLCKNMNGVEIAKKLKLTPQAISPHIMFIKEEWIKYYN